MPVHEHLFRVGLEQWAPTFEQRGFRFKADLKDLTIDAVKKWSPMLRYVYNVFLACANKFSAMLPFLPSHSQPKKRKLQSFLCP